MQRTGPTLRILLVAAAALAAVVAVPLSINMLMRPAVLKVAVGPPQSEDTRLVTAAAQLLVREEASVRLRVVGVEGFEAAARALEKGTVDAAVLRGDVPTPDNARTVAILHRNAAVFMAPAGRGIAEIASLADRRIGVLRLGPINERLLDTILGAYDVKPESVRRVALQPQDVAAAFRDGTIDALLAIGPVAGALVTDAVQDVTRATGAPPVFIPIREAAALSRRNPSFDPIEVPRGSFGTAPPLPPLSFPTLGVTYRLVVDADERAASITELTRTLFDYRRDLVDAAPIAAGLEAPDTDPTAQHPVHPGAALYLDGEEPSFFEKYVDWFYLGAMGAGLLASGGAAVWGRRKSRTGAAAVRAEHLLALIRDARNAPDLEALQGVEAEADKVLLDVMKAALDDAQDAGAITAAGLGLDHVRGAIRERREELAR